MAKFDVLTFKGKQKLGLNIDRSVGSGGKNDFADVSLIQAIFIYLAPGYDYFANSSPVVPKMTGEFDTVTGDAIRKFQQDFAYRLIQIDGTVHPASYENRNIQKPLDPLMTITYMHILCKHVGQRYYAHPRYAVGITTVLPKLLPLLRHPDLRNLYWIE